MTPKLGFLNLATGINTATAILGDKKFLLSHIAKDDDSTAEDLGCAQRGSLAHTLSVVGLGLSRLLYALKQKAWPNSLIQTSLGITTEKVTALSLSDSTFETAVTL